MVNPAKIVFSVLLIFFSFSGHAQDKINWLSFEELETAQLEQAKKILLYFHTDWCVYCKKMDRKVFTKSTLITFLNAKYYAVSFDAESEASIRFQDQIYINDQVGKSRNPLHQITQLLATRQGKFVAPTIVVLDESFNISARYFEYMTSEELLELLN